MKKLDGLFFEQYRDRSPEVFELYGSFGNEDWGAFFVPCPHTGVTLRVIASADLDWDHVSVSLPRRTPNWYEMEYIRKLFFKADEVVMQLHLPAELHITFHPHCLHMWRPWRVPIPLPQPMMV